MVSMPHSLLLRDLSILPTPVRWRSEYVHIVAQSREYVHTTYRVEVCPTRYEVATPILPRPQSYLSGGIPPRPRLAKGFLLCISYEVLSRSVTQPRSVASHTRSHAWPLVTSMGICLSRGCPSPCCCASLDPPVSYVYRGLRPPRLTVSAAVGSSPGSLAVRGSNALADVASPMSRLDDCLSRLLAPTQPLGRK